MSDFELRFLVKRIKAMEPARSLSGQLLIGGKARQVIKEVKTLQFRRPNSNKADRKWRDVPVVFEGDGDGDDI